MKPKTIFQQVYDQPSTIVLNGSNNLDRKMNNAFALLTTGTVNQLMCRLRGQLRRH